MTRVAIIASLVSVASIDPALAQPLYCSTRLGITTCSSPGGYVSDETEWMGRANGWDNQGSRWTTSRWLDVDTTTVEPLPER